MVKTRGNQRRFFITISLGFFAQWNGVWVTSAIDGFSGIFYWYNSSFPSGVVSYYLPLILNTIGMTSVTQQTLINACLQIWNLIISASASLFVDRAGRRVLFLLSTGIMLTCYITITALSGEFAKTGINSVGTAVIPFLFLYYGGYGIAFTPLLITYPSEIWGFSMRAKGLALQVISTSVALVFNLFANPVALEAISWKYYIVYICILVLILFVVYFTYPETKGYTLEEVAVVFEEDKGGDKTNEHIERVSTEK
jgi:MFS family permease